MNNSSGNRAGRESLEDYFCIGQQTCGRGLVLVDNPIHFRIRYPEEKEKEMESE